MAKFRRPTRIMQEAVNLAMDGKRAKAVKLVAEHKNENDMHTAKALDVFVAKREESEKGPYTFERKPRGAKAGKAAASDIASSIDGRTTTVNLLKLEAKLGELLAKKPKTEVTKVRNALSNYDKKREELDEMETLLGL